MKKSWRQIGLIVTGVLAVVKIVGLVSALSSRAVAPRSFIVEQAIFAVAYSFIFLSVVFACSAHKWQSPRASTGSAPSNDGRATLDDSDETLESKITAWLQREYPEETDWNDTDYHCFAGAPVEFAMLPAHATLEYNLSNGGWSQVLWNCIAHWRDLLSICVDGYTLIGAIAQAEALTHLYDLCECDEVECLSIMERDLSKRKDLQEAFSQFTSRSYGASDNDWQKLFYSDAGLDDMRSVWLASHEAQVKDELRRNRAQHAICAGISSLQIIDDEHA